jgi:hypothetical protein
MSEPPMKGVGSMVSAEYPNKAGGAANSSQASASIEPAPVVAEVRRAPIDLDEIRAQFDADWVLNYRNSEALLAEVVRLTAERDEARAALLGTLKDTRLLARTEKAEADLEALRTRLRGLEQQWRAERDAVHHLERTGSGGDYKAVMIAARTRLEDCADELARLLTTPEEPNK